MNEDQHRPGAVGTEKIGDAPASFPKFRFEYFHAGVEPVYGPLNDRNEESVRLSVCHYGIRQLPVHLADPNSRFNCSNSELTGEPPMKSATACRSLGCAPDSIPLDKVARHVVRDRPKHADRPATRL